MFCPPGLFDMPTACVRLLKALRHVMLCRAVGRDPSEGLAAMLAAPADRVVVIALDALIVQSWPAPFQLFRPCCRHASPDEMVIVQALMLARNQDQRRFVHLVRDLLRPDISDRLFRLCADFSGAPAQTN